MELVDGVVVEEREEDSVEKYDGEGRPKEDAGEEAGKRARGHGGGVLAMDGRRGGNDGRPPKKGGDIIAQPIS